MPRKACAAKPAAAQRSCITGTGVWVPSRFEGLTTDHKGSTSRRAKTPAPEDLLAGSGASPRRASDAADGWAKSRKVSKRVDQTGASERRELMHNLMGSRYLRGSGLDALDHSHYGSNVLSGNPGPGRKLYETGRRSHSNHDLWGAISAPPKLTQRRQHGSGPGERVASLSAPGTPRGSDLTYHAPFDRTFSGSYDQHPRNLQDWRPWRRKLRTQSPFGGQSQLLGHTILNDTYNDYGSGRHQSPRPAHSLGGSGVSWTREEPGRPVGKSCGLTPERRRVAQSTLTGAGAVHDVGPGFNPHTGVRGKSCQSPARPRDSFQGAGMEMLI